MNGSSQSRAANPHWPVRLARVRNSDDYPNFPKSGRFRLHGAGKDYYRAWEDFLTGITDTEPPEFQEFVKRWRKQKGIGGTGA